jgi:Fe-S cluster assembly protein SufD
LEFKDCQTMNAAHYLEQYQSYALPGQDLPWLAAIRQSARACFAAGGFPSPREEEWKYTNVSVLEKRRFAPLAGPTPATVDEVWLEKRRLRDAWSLVLLEGRFAPGLSRLEGLPTQVVATGMAEALRDYPQRVEARLGAALGAESHGFLAFNTAFFSDGAFIDIPAGLNLDKPLQILHVRVRPEGLANTRSLVHLGANAQAKLVESYTGLEDLAYLTAAVTEIVLGENAGLEHGKVQTEADKAYHFGGLYVKHARHSRFAQHNLAFGSLLARTEIRAELAADAECELNGLFLGQGRQHLDNHTLIRHVEPHGTSRETYRGVLAERARGVFQGRIVVHPQAQKTSAEMNSRNLLLSEDAEIDAKPQLEILADDVKCAHGVAIGRLDPESLFYLESRGVDAESARNMLTFAFAHSMIDKIGLDSLRAQAQDLLLDRFPQTGIRRDWL